MKYVNFKLPAMAAILGLVALIGTAAINAADRPQQTAQWTYTPAQSGPLDPANYEKYDDPAGLEALCSQDNDICGVIAPIDPTSDPGDPKPDLSDPDLQQRIDDEDVSEDDVFLLPEM